MPMNTLFHVKILPWHWIVEAEIECRKLSKRCQWVTSAVIPLIFAAGCSSSLQSPIEHQGLSVIQLKWTRWLQNLSLSRSSASAFTLDTMLNLWIDMSNTSKCMALVSLNRILTSTLSLLFRSIWIPLEWLTHLRNYSLSVGFIDSSL